MKLSFIDKRKPKFEPKVITRKEPEEPVDDWLWLLDRVSPKDARALRKKVKEEPFVHKVTIETEPPPWDE